MKILHQTKVSLFQILVTFLVLVVIGIISFFSFGEHLTPAKSAFVENQKKETIPLLNVKDTSTLGQLLFAVDTLANSPELNYGSFGFSLVSLDSGKVICEYNSRKSLVPASVIKIVSTGIALAKLGPEFQYTTRLQYDGEIDVATKILHGNIYIKGSGDPSLGADVFGNSVKNVLSSWTTAIKNLGIDSIDGAIIGDGESFEHQQMPGGWAWEDMQSSYGIGCSGLSFRENTCDINIKCKGKNLYATIFPPIPGIILHNQLLYNPQVAKNYLYVSGAPYQNERTIMGEIKSDYTDKSNIPDPPLCCAYNLLLNLQSNGIKIKDSCTTMMALKRKGKISNKERKTIHNTYSLLFQKW